MNARKNFWSAFSLFLSMFYWFCYYSCPIFSPFHSPLPCTAPSSLPPIGSCPWIIHISSLASPFPILFLTSPCLFCTYHVCFLFSVSFPPFSSLYLPTDNPPCDLYFCDSVSVLVVCLVWFCFLGSVVDSCEFVVILLIIVLIIFFSLDKSL